MKLFWPVTGADFARSIKWARTQFNPVALTIKRQTANVKKR